MFSQHTKHVAQDSLSLRFSLLAGTVHALTYRTAWWLQRKQKVLTQFRHTHTLQLTAS